MHCYGMACLMVGHNFFFFGRDQPAAALGASDDSFDGFLEFLVGDGAAVAAGSQDGRLIHEILDVCASETWRLFGHRIQIQIGCQAVCRAHAHREWRVAP